MKDYGNKEIMSENIQHQLKVKGKTRHQVCDDLGISYSTFCDWANGTKYPRIDKIEILARYFGINKSDLIEEQDYTHPYKFGDHSFTQQEYDEIVSYINYLISKRKV